MKKLEMNIEGITADKGQESKLTLVFDESMTTEVFNALTNSVVRLRAILEQRGLITKVGVSPAEMPQYLQYMKPIVDEAEHGIKQLYIVKDEVKKSQLVCKFVIMDMIQERIDEAFKTVDEYYEMFEEMGYYKPNLEFTKPFEIKDSE